jgi:hypothetical protein
MILYSAKRHLSKYNGSRVTSIKMYELHISTALHIRIFGFHKNGLIKSCSSLMTYQHIKFHGPLLTRTIFASTSGV